ncbi:PhzF family phenazine biosynthesis protein [Deinococcus taeanensis]|uniref:PhzF family phenazine biosynthesis protein n=1 Tax=Deinococcus taeanensis TaxID=2737050 RepID=UPI001CDB7D17|nr:PhzF family phenazine biosynthesis protein [Deinococcus taeanensis]UBV41556.1 PhzF family phenazine biosynthesis protein [Deinococcus taeanensis]
MTPPDAATRTLPLRYRAFADRGAGGKPVTVFLNPGDEQDRARQAGTPLSVFVQASDPASVTLRVFTPHGEKGSSDSAAIAALSALQETGLLLDVVEVTQGDPQTGAEVQPAQLCGGEWLLRQGLVTVQAVHADLSPLGLTSGTAWVAATNRTNLVAEVADLPALDAFTPDDAAISAVNRATGTTGLILFTPGGPARAEVSFRAFGPLKGFSEDAASSNMLACLTGVLDHLNHLPEGATLIRAAQRRPGQPARLSAQYARTTGGTDVWVGGPATPDTP